MLYAKAKMVENFPKGSFHSITWNKVLATRKGVDARVEKISKASAVRFGVDYSHLDKVKERNGVDEKGNAITHKPSWWTWLNHPYFMQNVKDPSKIYLRVTTSNNTKVETEYFKDGIKISRAEAESLCPKSQFSSGAKTEVFSVGIENIIEIK